MQTLSRKNHSTKGQELPTEWLDKVRELLNQLYQRECKQSGKEFEAFGQIFDDELLLLISFVDNRDHSSLPVTCFLSADIGQKDDSYKNLNKLLDMAGVIFDNIFAQKEWNEYETNWVEHTQDSVTFYYKISRENITLTLEADAILKGNQ